MNNARPIKWLLGDPITAGKAARTIIVGTVVVTLACGSLIHFFDKQDYPTFGSGMWWAIQTVTTVGYGDNVPTTTTGKSIASVLMVAGIAVISVLTGTVTAALVESARVRNRLGEQDRANKLDEIGAKLDRLESRLNER